MPDQDLSVIRFTETAQDFCNLLEEGDSVAMHPFLHRCLKLILVLLSQALELPNLKGHFHAGQVTREEYWDVVHRIKARLGDRDSYRMVFEPFETTQPEAIHGSFSDDLSDIWRDLKDGLLLAKAGKIADAVCGWRLSFESHWGPCHAAHVVRPLFGLLFGENAISIDTDAG